MSATFQKIEEEFQRLSAEEKAGLICKLIAELDATTDENLEQAWLAEAKRRHQQCADGKVRTVPADQVFARLQTRLSS